MRDEGTTAARRSVRRAAAVSSPLGPQTSPLKRWRSARLLAGTRRRTLRRGAANDHRPPSRVIGCPCLLNHELTFLCSPGILRVYIVRSRRGVADACRQLPVAAMRSTRKTGAKRRVSPIKSRVCARCLILDPRHPAPARKSCHHRPPSRRRLFFTQDDAGRAGEDTARSRFAP